MLFPVEFTGDNSLYLLQPGEYFVIFEMDIRNSIFKDDNQRRMI
jgi:hypothetical protein